MTVFDWNFKDVFDIKENIIMILGSFETLHLGHYELIKAAKAKKEILADAKIGIMLFSAPYKNNKQLQKKAFQTKVRLFSLYNLGIDYVFLVQSTQDNLNTSHKDFINNLKQNKVIEVICGPDFRFGFRKLGDINYLKKHFELNLINERKVQKKKISSSLINELIEEGNISAANSLLIDKYAFVCSIENFKYEYPKQLNKLKCGIYIVNVVINDIEYHGLTKISLETTKEDQKNNELYFFDLSVIPSKYQDIYIEFELPIRFIGTNHENNINENDIDTARQWFLNK
ncbi:riboflavin biosynthesis protein [Mycoplasma enhydrae]|uniref:FAD synthase n=1 Tax=Mycoplasma enhydrae TaxID=2499220 RepID=UPI0021E8B330|nr:riboflavin biosynthesis protein [Mycoplasma enhydrae]MCV3733852.1 riboflavin biosynthesis protein [Mycoplasma enhydrae]